MAKARLLAAFVLAAAGCDASALPPDGDGGSVADLGGGRCGAALGLMPMFANFGAVEVGKVSATPVGFSVLLRCDRPSGVPTVQVAGEFAVATNGCDKPLPGNGSCPLKLIHRPLSAGAKSGTLTVTAFPFGSVVAALEATGVAP